jgi:predicted transcriptional regulator
MASLREVAGLAKYHRRSKSGGSRTQQPPDAELDVLACLWRRRRATARQVREALHSYRPMAHGSVVTLLNRLEARGLVARRKGPVGKAFIYRPTRATRPAYRRIVRNIIKRLFGGDSLEMVSALLNAKVPTSDELDQLQQMLDELRSKRKKKKQRGNS